MTRDLALIAGRQQALLRCRNRFAKAGTMRRMRLAAGLVMVLILVAGCARPAPAPDHEPSLVTDSPTPDTTGPASPQPMTGCPGSLMAVGATWLDAAMFEALVPGVYPWGNVTETPPAAGPLAHVGGVANASLQVVVWQDERQSLRIGPDLDLSALLVAEDAEATMSSILKEMTTAEGPRIRGWVGMALENQTRPREGLSTYSASLVGPVEVAAAPFNTSQVVVEPFQAAYPTWDQQWFNTTYAWSLTTRKAITAEWSLQANAIGQTQYERMVSEDRPDRPDATMILEQDLNGTGLPMPLDPRPYEMMREC